ncbi:DUF2019 domain-containing protein [Clostridium grantii]|uniref:Uncharacterized protein n=1 Tax=Clostridium grantii DSM 8605 TaxID=1121316 RepID=A0A1M5Y6Y9_9CLOT|nr:DUF2019 domain-containing protein [Clostridium grantii]SHI07736.1 protein of unknown function [Clostridium grantii DSM 8605]
MKDIEKIIQEYTEAAIKYGNATEEGKYKIVNNQYKIIEKNIDKLKSIENGINKLENLLEHQSDYVKLWSARYLLYLKEQKAKETLLILIQKSGVIGFDAKMTLEEWGKGNISK